MTPEEIISKVKIYDPQKNDIKDIRQKIMSIRTTKDFPTYAWDSSLGDFVGIQEAYQKIHGQVVGASLPKGNTFQKLGEKYPEYYQDPDTGQFRSPITWMSYILNNKEVVGLNEIGADDSKITSLMLEKMNNRNKLPLSGAGDKKKLFISTVILYLHIFCYNKDLDE